MPKIKFKTIPDLDRLRDEINDTVDDIIETFASSIQSEKAHAKQKEWRPAVDVYETEDHLMVEIELPGINQDNVQLAFQDNILTLNVEKKQEDDENRTHHRRERSYGHFRRNIPLPVDVDSENINASFQDGLLKIVFTTIEKTKSKKIEINSGE